MRRMSLYLGAPQPSTSWEETSPTPSEDIPELDVSRSQSSSSTLDSEAPQSESAVSTADSTTTTDSVTTVTATNVSLESITTASAAERIAGAKTLPESPHAVSSISVVAETKNFRFNERVLVGETWPAAEYDRRGEALVRLTPALAHAIRMELNEYKVKEMSVHEESRVYTHLLA